MMESPSTTQPHSMVKNPISPTVIVCSETIPSPALTKASTAP